MTKMFLFKKMLQAQARVRLYAKQLQNILRAEVFEHAHYIKIQRKIKKAKKILDRILDETEVQA